MTPYANEILGQDQCGFKRNRSTVEHIFSIRQTLKKEQEYYNDICKELKDFEKAYDSIKGNPCTIS